MIVVTSFYESTTNTVEHKPAGNKPAWDGTPM